MNKPPIKPHDAPVDITRESVAGEEDPGASFDEVRNEVYGLDLTKEERAALDALADSGEQGMDAVVLEKLQRLGYITEVHSGAGRRLTAKGELTRRLVR